MKIVRSVFFHVKDWFSFFLRFLISWFKTSQAKNLEILALRSQLALYQQYVDNKKFPKPKTTPAFRQLWVLLSRVFSNWKIDLTIVKPATVIKWHRTAFRINWRSKSRKTGRPSISRETIALIKRIHKENPMFSPEKIHEKFKQLGVNNPPAPNTIAKYFPKTRKPPSQKQIQSWKTFLKNHQSRIWAMDFFTIPTLKFEVLYVFILIKHSTREIIHFGITPNPNSRWLKQCLRTATPYDFKPEYLIHDNDPVFLAKEIQDFLQASEIKSKKTSIQSPWQNPIAERAVGILRQELLNHIIPLNEDHLHQLLKEYIDDYYNTYRTHQGIDCKTPIPGEVYFPTDISNTRLKANPILNGLYHNYKKIS